MDTILTDFPILIYLSDTSGIDGENVSFIFDEIGGNSLKIAVTLDDGLTECYVEVEKWDSGNRQAWLWSKIASISNITDTEIYLYYDNDHADNTDKVGATNSVPAENVWDADFELVSHMRDDPDTSHIRDSTSNDNDGNKSGANAPPVTTNGKIDDAQDFESGDADDIDLGTPSIGVSDITVEAWIKVESNTGNYEFIFNDYNKNQVKGWQLFWLTSGGDPRIYASNIEDGTHYRNSYSSARAIGTWWHAVGVIFADGSQPDVYVNGVLDVDGVANLGAPSAIAEGSGNTVIGGQSIPAERYFDGVIDEVRLSKTGRTVAWIKATYETGRDHLLDYGSEEESPIPDAPTKLFGAGFNGSTPVIHLYWKCNLTDFDLFEVQNSTDKASWDYLGTNTTAEYHDFEVVNGTERYYRVRACNFVDPDWFNSTWTDINFETVYFLPTGAPIEIEVNVTGTWVDYNFTSIVTVVGDNVTGFLNSTYFKDGDFYSVDEVTGAPGYDIRFNVTGLPDNLICLCLDLFMYYDGSGGHTFQIEVWNFTDSNWDFIDDIPDECCRWFNNTLECVPDDYVQNGTLMGRFYHPSPGNVNHVWGIDYGKLRVYVPYEDVPAVLAMGRYYALAIILLILGILLGLGMRRGRR